MRINRSACVALLICCTILSPCGCKKQTHHIDISLQVCTHVLSETFGHMADTKIWALFVGESINKYTYTSPYLYKLSLRAVFYLQFSCIRCQHMLSGTSHLVSACFCLYLKIFISWVLLGPSNMITVSM